jgi:DNA processing protein
MNWSREFQTALYSLDGVGPVTFHHCLKTLKNTELSEADFWVNKANIWQEIRLSEKTVQSIRKFNKEYTSDSYFELLSSKNIRVILPADQEFPPLLKQLPRHPPVLFARGGQLTGKEAFLAVVGTRNITDYGQRVIKDFIPPLVQLGKTIVSGFMYGVDVAAQSLVLEEGGKTVGVLGFGFDHMYPPGQRRLFDQFLNQGATFFSPFAPHVPAKPGNFPARNAVVAGMSEGVLVIEGAGDSGSLITAHYAAELGRDVWAVPGSIYSRFSIGPQKLLNEGAQLVNSAEEMFGLTKRQRQKKEAQRQAWTGLPELKRKICELLWTESATTDDLHQKLTCSSSTLAINLVELELLGLIEQKGNIWLLK